MMDTYFKLGDRVTWHHLYAAQFAPETVVRAEAVPQLPEDHPDLGDPGTGQFGTIVAQANEKGTWWEVSLDNAKDGETRVLTNDELVRISEPQEDTP